MNELFYLIILIIISYLIGSTPTSIIVGRITKGIDIREHGSGNAGGTNVFRVLGWKPALFVVVIDVFKGWLPAAIFAPAFYYAQIIPDLGVVQILCGFSAVLGHTYTIFAGFKGGKGVGTLGGMLIALFPTAFPFCLAIAII
ncbi:MAG: acyl-phosphate glycerol 3-phosphate acyltransferase, partial [Candidatus Marinimicrobia bacterium]|nr:acyl-phosphate glycerol 3-phosphate acyltransferase [Candidatus Neomarinimicrobiota bacterium]